MNEYEVEVSVQAVGTIRVRATSPQEAVKAVEQMGSAKADRSTVLPFIRVDVLSVMQGDEVVYEQ